MTHLGHLGFGLHPSPAALPPHLFLVLHMSSVLGLYPGRCECSVVENLESIKHIPPMRCFSFSRQLMGLDSNCKLSSFGWWQFRCQFNYFFPPQRSCLQSALQRVWFQRSARDSGRVYAQNVELPSLPFFFPEFSLHLLSWALPPSGRKEVVFNENISSSWPHFVCVSLKTKAPKPGNSPCVDLFHGLALFPNLPLLTLWSPKRMVFCRLSEFIVVILRRRVSLLRSL